VSGLRLRIVGGPPDVVVTLEAFAAGYRCSPFAPATAANRGTEHVQVLRYLTEPPERGGLGHRRLSPKAMSAVLHALAQL